MCTSLKLTLFLAKSRSKISRIIIYMPVESYGWSILSRHSTYAIKTSVRIKRFNKQILLLHYIKRERLVKKKKDRGKEAVIHAHHLMCKWFWDSSQSSLAGILFWHQAVSKTSTLSMLLHHDTYHLPLDTSEKVHRFNDQPFMYAFKISFLTVKFLSLNTCHMTWLFGIILTIYLDSSCPLPTGQAWPMNNLTF